MIDDVTERGGAFARAAVNLFWKPTDGSGSAEPLTTSDYAQQPLSWSPDGKLLVFHQSLHPETGRDEIYVTEFPESGGKWRIWTNGGTEPAWAPSDENISIGMKSV